jgi:hypothetical protein
MLDKLRAAMIAPGRELLKGEVEIDEFFLGGYEEGLKGGRHHDKKVLCGAAVEVRGQGSGRLASRFWRTRRRRRLKSSRRRRRLGARSSTPTGSPSYNGLAKLGYDHRPRKVASVGEEEKLLPRVHRAARPSSGWASPTSR